MDIGTVSNQPFPSIGYAMNASRNGRMSLPVAPGVVIYSHFKHVSGTPAPEGSKGVNISRLKILDTLIEQLSKMKNQPAMDFGGLDKNDEKRIDALIEQYHAQVRAIQSGSYAPAAAAGLLFNISA